MIVAIFALLTAAAIGFLVRLVRGPSIADRIVALDGVLLVVVSALAVDAARVERAVFIDAVVVVGLLGFVGTAVAARFIERRGG